jgi:hypothetical protein
MLYMDLLRVRLSRLILKVSLLERLGNDVFHMRMDIRPKLMQDVPDPCSHGIPLALLYPSSP